MAAKLIEVATQRFVDNITSITPGALKGGIQSVKSHPLRDEIVFGGADGTPRIYRMQRMTAAANRRRCQSALGTSRAPRPRVQRRYHARRLARLPPAAASTVTAHVHVYRMDPAPKIPEPIQAILNKPVQERSAEETAALHKHFEQGVSDAGEVRSAPRAACMRSPQPEGRSRCRRRWRWHDPDYRNAKRSLGFVVCSGAKLAKPTQKQSPRSTSFPSSLRFPRWPANQPLPAGDAIVKLDVEPAAIQLDSPSRYAQVIVTAELASGAQVDVTRQAKFTFSEPVAAANSLGFVTPLANGHAMLTIALGDKSANIDVQVANLDHHNAPDFVRDVAPMLARAGCNQGTCHGAQAGKNGFKLSLRGYDPIFDVRALTDDLRIAPREHRLARPKLDAAQAHRRRAAHRRPGHQAGKHVLRNSPRVDCCRRAAQPGRHRASPAIKVTPQNPVDRNHRGPPTSSRHRDLLRRHRARCHARGVRRKRQYRCRENRPRSIRACSNRCAAAKRPHSFATKASTPPRRSPSWAIAPASLGKICPRTTTSTSSSPPNCKRTKTLPSAQCDDYEFVRRVYLDLTGCRRRPSKCRPSSTTSAKPSSSAMRSSIRSSATTTTSISGPTNGPTS